jgi:GntR family transcriptional regulator, transcriptional repressor for pyruvate dehydrogenase complex
MKTHPPRDNVLFTPLPEKRTFREIEQQIRRLIYSKAVKPGDKLPSEHELASQFRAGRLSVREALRMLEQAGLIEVRQGSTGGSYVRELDGTEAAQPLIDLLWQGDVRVEDVTDARSAIEQLILEKAFGALTEDGLLSLETSVKELEALVAEGKREEQPVHPTLTDFHLLLARLTNNPIFPIVLRVLLEVNLRVMEPAVVDLERLKKHAAAHRSIADALRAGELNTALRAMERHMKEVGDKRLNKAAEPQHGTPEVPGGIRQ